MSTDADPKAVARRMRQDWNQRAVEDAQRYVYTRDAETDVAGFDASGLANYDQLIRPYLPLLLDGAPARACRILEIGCGAGRMTRCFAAHFGAVHALDVSGEMLKRAAAALDGFSNVEFVEGTGFDLAGCPGGAFDLVFSYIVFQHIPSAGVVESYVREAARVLKPGGCFKFQVNGDRSTAYLAHERDTWQGETFSREQVRAMLDAAGLAWVASEGENTQYFVVTARKGSYAGAAGTRSDWLAGENWAAAQVIEGVGEPVNSSWRPMESRARLRLRMPEGAGRRFYFGAYLWPGESRIPCSLTAALGGRPLGAAAIDRAGDAYIEFEAPDSVGAGDDVEVEVVLEPAASKPPALRALGLYTPRGAPDYDRKL
jgi:ubiquinone/menaquinone biosynthesis C-methylase UbiE